MTQWSLSLGRRKWAPPFPQTSFSYVCFCTAEVGKQPGRQSKETVWGCTRKKEGNTYGCIFNTYVNCLFKSAVDRSRVLDNSTETEELMRTGSISCIRRNVCVFPVYISVIRAYNAARRKHFPHFSDGSMGCLMMTPMSMVIFSTDSSDLTNNEMICTPAPCSRWGEQLGKNPDDSAGGVVSLKNTNKISYMKQTSVLSIFIKDTLIS